MSLIPALDAQDQNPSSANEESFRTSRTRVQEACKECRSRKVKCDGVYPCEGCRHNLIECVYQNVEPTKQQKSLTSLHNTLTTVHQELHSIRTELGGLNKGYFDLDSIPLNPGREHGTKAFLCKELHRLSHYYVENVHPLHPFFDKPQEMCNEFINDPIFRKGMIMSYPRNARVLLLFALGSCQTIADNTGSSHTLPGSVYYSYAKDIIKHRLGECNIFVAQALTLAALYTNQHGMLQESLTHLSNACGIYTDVFKNSTSISGEAKKSFWVYQDLAYGITNCFNWVSFSPVLNHWSKLYPKGNVGEFHERVYWTKVTLRILLDFLRSLARPYCSTTREMDEEDLDDLARLANKQIGILEGWRSALIAVLAWKDTDSPSTDPLTASLRAEYYEGAAELLRPYVGIAEHALHSKVRSRGDESSRCQQGLLKVLLDWEKHALLSTVCFDRVSAAFNSTYEMYQTTGGSPVMLSNPVSTLHTEFKTVSLCWIIRSSAIYPLIAKQTKLTDSTMDTLRRRTIKRLSEFFPSHPILSRDLKAMNRLWLLGDSVPLMELVRAYELV